MKGLWPIAAPPSEIDALWKPNSSIALPITLQTWPNGPMVYGGIFDYDAKSTRLAEVSEILEDPNIWNDAKRAQDLGREKKSLEGVVVSLGKI